MKKYKNKYRIESIRAQWWDYGMNGAYFITICTHNREHFFGKIVQGQFVPTEMGEIAHAIWHEIPRLFPYVILGDFVVMPDHIHGILIVNKRKGEVDAEAGAEADADEDADAGETRLIASPPLHLHPQKTGGFAGNKNPMLNENISRIVRWYKGRCSFEIRKKNTDFAWQSRFHDHIIRSNAAYQRISNYIINNPRRWKGK